MARVSLALFWHQHQPYYPDDVSGENPMPWVRLHGTKDYLGMALHLEEVPEFRCTINLVPSLLLQLEGYVLGTASDRHLDVSRAPADGLSRDDAFYLVDNFFMAYPDVMIRPHPRYWELYQMRGLSVSTGEQALPRFRERDLRDLQVWSNLAWFHPLLFERDPELADFREKGRHYSEAEKTWLLNKQRSLLGEIVPLHRKLAERGQVELTTTPFYHPILPLLFDKRLAREAMPDVRLPDYQEGYPEDAETHVARAVESHRRHFGQEPKGMWPSEGSVCQAMLPMLAKHGIEWIATDEEILGRSLSGKVHRDSRGHVKHPELLYRPWNVSEAGHDLAIIFRDHALSDQIGFHYQRSPGASAAQDFLGKLHAIGDACKEQGSALVPVVLDGENCWEYYPDGGVSFLRSLYQQAVSDPRLEPVTVSEYLAENPPKETLPRLFPGSWIGHNFAIWVGHDEDNRAWDALHEARLFLKQQAIVDRHDKVLLARAWHELYIAEGSDWFWWFGDDHSSALDALFDHLFRKHLRNIYTLLGQEPPRSLFTPISQAAPHRPIHQAPTSFLRVKVNGRSTYFEWINAARYTCGNDRGTMTLVSQGILREIWFGFDETRFLLRVDTEGAARERLKEADRLVVGFVEPESARIVIEAPARPTPRAVFKGAKGHSPNGRTVEAATDLILELALPFERLGRVPGEAVRFFVELFQGETSVDRAPREGLFELSVPSADFERVMWQV